MKYRTKSMSFYVDGHERGDVTEYQTWFIKEYLHKWETRCMRFVRLTEEQMAEIPELPPSECLRVNDEDGGFFYEVHEDRLHYLKGDGVQAYADSLPRQQSIRTNICLV